MFTILYRSADQELCVVETEKVTITRIVDPTPKSETGQKFGDRDRVRVSWWTKGCGHHVYVDGGVDVASNIAMALYSTDPRVNLAAYQDGEINQAGIWWEPSDSFQSESSRQAVVTPGDL